MDEVTSEIVLIDYIKKLLAFGYREETLHQGATVELTLDRDIQYAAEKSLQKAVVDAQAVAGTAMVMDPQTGEILASANVPTFNPNAAGQFPASSRRNRSSADAFEPGSIETATAEQRDAAPSEISATPTKLRASFLKTIVRPHAESRASQSFPQR